VRPTAKELVGTLTGSAGPPKQSPLAVQGKPKGGPVLAWRPLARWRSPVAREAVGASRPRGALAPCNVSERERGDSLVFGSCPAARLTLLMLRVGEGGSGTEDDLNFKLRYPFPWLDVSTTFLTLGLLPSFQVLVYMCCTNARRKLQRVLSKINIVHQTSMHNMHQTYRRR
jgi:hypothetical protein